MTSALFESILIANRGEIACRVIGTCRRLGIRAAAVYSDADAHSRHVRLADMAVRIGPPPAQESYLAIDRVIDAARKTGAQAIHPGYGFLAENADFADACAAAGIVFIGPPSAAIRAMGSKAAAKALMRDAGVSLTPGYDGENQDARFLERQADAIGYPVMIKANAGGGGKGMRRVDAAEQFQAALASCKREAAAAFGDDSVLIEKYVVGPRHVEVQVFGDKHGNIVSLFERDCSVQRRHQKVIEEAPAPLITVAQREALGKAARDAARAVGYVGAGTVEFLFDGQAFYFMEMNTRLQVEHPVTEMITGLDLVEWQLRIAAGESLPVRQEELAFRGHAIEARVYAEDPNHDFLPSIGKLVHLAAPAQSEHLRIDTGVEQGDIITPFYDPMIAKVIVWDQTRELAAGRMNAALGEYQVVGVANNVGFLRRLVTSPSFVFARLDTGLIEREHDWLWPKQTTIVPDAAIVVAALSIVLRERQDAAQRGPRAFAVGDRRWLAPQRCLQAKICLQAGRTGAGRDYGVSTESICHLDRRSQLFSHRRTGRKQPHLRDDRWSERAGDGRQGPRAHSRLCEWEIVCSGLRRSTRDCRTRPQQREQLAGSYARPGDRANGTGRPTRRKGRAADGAGSDEDGMYDSCAGSRPG